MTEMRTVIVRRIATQIATVHETPTATEMQTVAVPPETRILI